MLVHLNPSHVCRRRIPLAPLVLLMGIAAGPILVNPGLASAQNRNVNDELRRSSNAPLFDGTSIDVNDLFRAAELLSRQNATSRWDSGAGIDAAVEQFKRSRRPLLLSPSSLTPEPSR